MFCGAGSVIGGPTRTVIVKIPFARLATISSPCNSRVTQHRAHNARAAHLDLIPHRQHLPEPPVHQTGTDSRLLAFRCGILPLALDDDLLRTAVGVLGEGDAEVGPSDAWHFEVDAVLPCSFIVVLFGAQSKGT